MQIGFGDYGILQRVADGEKMRHYEDTLWTMLGGGLLTIVLEDDVQYLKITDQGREYLRKFKRPEFPKTRKFEQEFQKCVVCTTRNTFLVCSCCRERIAPKGVNVDDQRWFHQQCMGKNRFPRQDSAENAARDMETKKKSVGSDKTFDVYQCPWCDCWHIGRTYVPVMEES